MVVGNRRAWVPGMVAAIKAAMLPRLKRDGAVWLRATSGAQSVDVRLAMAEEYMRLQVGPREEHRAACIVATLDSIRTSIDLHDTDRVIIAALPWTPEGIEQFEGRFRRIGQKRPVQYDYVVAEGTIDDAIEDTLLSKMICVGTAGAEVDTDARRWLENAQPSGAEILDRMNLWMAARSEVIERAVMEG